MTSKFIELGCPIRIINGMNDHIHCLFLLNPNRSMADIVKNEKGSTSHFINHFIKPEEKFEWQHGYGSFSISESELERTFLYIKNQKVKHLNQEYFQAIKENIATF